ncbi:MAG: hypothetical protein HRT44_02595 [Bdellovibrionales bacterium]|nr:hypothetical protein [Bdellovibrionales bacterium]NQZ18136.1 hypothetical protein [Bdellovibrionales bacterium]
MFFSDKADLISLDFTPRKPCFSKAQMEWRGVVLNGKVSQDKPIVDLSDEKLDELIFELFGELSFVELAELHEAIESSDISESMNWELYAKKMKIHWNQRNRGLFAQVCSLPESFKSWCDERKVSASDLMPLNSLRDMETFIELSPVFSELRLTRNDGKKVIDLLVDLLLMGTPTQELRPEDGQDWLKALYNKRYPNTQETDHVRQTQTSWPEFAQVQNRRHGDRLTYNMQIQYLDNKDLTSKLNRLSQIAEKS